MGFAIKLINNYICHNYISQVNLIEFLFEARL